ncbi:hypothetical protein E2C01_009779 [Portunus trituberculatus]|uniref:Uncharacterized protein n=1 Tax=Portunus trituberculatus TaxID=210409 RepID=A0A5B7D6W0_PORTR|nr:hypothetical protein [Portunus trituberculatus]
MFENMVQGELGVHSPWCLSPQLLDWHCCNVTFVYGVVWAVAPRDPLFTMLRGGNSSIPVPQQWSVTSMSSPQQC